MVLKYALAMEDGEDEECQERSGRESRASLYTRPVEAGVPTPWSSSGVVACFTQGAAETVIPHCFLYDFLVRCLLAAVR